MSGFVRKFKDMWAGPEDENYDEAYQEDPQQDSDDEPADDGRRYRESGRTSDGQGYGQGGQKVVNFHNTAQLQVVLFKPEHFGEDTRAIADELLKIHTVVLNLEGTPKEVKRRIIDFLSGVAYANGGKIKKVATDTFIITPYNVDLTGDDLLDELESSGLYF